MLRKIMILSFAAVLVGLTSTAAYAERLCGDRTEILERLEKAYSERPQALGLSSDSGLLEVLVSPAGGWTILVTYPKRPTCVFATGESWESLIVPAGQPA